MKHSARVFVGLASAFALTACSTPKPTRDLAAQGAIVIDQAQSEAQSFVERARLLLLARQGTVNDLARSDIKDTSTVEFNDWLAKEVGLAESDEQRALLVRKIIEKSRETRLAQEAALAKRTAEISATYGEPVVLPEAKLAAAKKAFLVLAQELTAEEWLKFAQRYAKEVDDGVKALKAADAASAPDDKPAEPAKTPVPPGT